MKLRSIAVFLLLAGTAGAQTYDPAAGKSPLVLLEAPKDGVAYYETKARARDLVKGEKYAEAEPLAEQLARDYPRDGENWMLLARVKRGLAKHLEAAAAYERAAALIGWDIEYSNGYQAAGSYMRAGDKRAALDLLRELIFERHGYFRGALYDSPSFESIKDDPEFLELIGRPDTSGWTRDEGWRRDVDFLYDETKRVNPDYRDKPFPAEITRRYEDLKKKVSKLSDEEIFVGMSRMLAPLRQGHVVLWTSPPLDRYLPVRLYAFPDGIYIVEGRGEHKDLAGSRVIAFGSVPAEEMLRRLAEASSADGDMQYLWGVSSLAETSWLKGLGATSSSESVTLTVQKPGTPGDTSRTVTLATSATRPEDRQDKLVAPPGVPPPLFLRDLNQMHWELALPEHDALYVQVNNVLDDEDEKLPDFGRRLWTVIEKTHPKNLILDLRHNNGGNTLIYPELLRTLVAFSREPGNQIYALIGRRSYSATGNFVTDLERLADPVFVGEASSECCNLYGDPTYVKLPYSKVEGEVTAVKWNLSSPSDRRREMSPEVPVQMTAQDYFAGRDPAIEAVYRMIAARGKKLALSPCETSGFPEGALCGTYEVFENRAARSGRKIPLRVMLVPANVPNKEPDAITFFAGGPGESAVDSGSWLTDVIRAQGPQTRDLLLVDLRGTGKSAPLDCPSLSGPQSVQGFLDDFMPVEGVRACREQLSRTADLTQYTSEIAVDDVDEVRAALGYEKLNVVGASYGTRTAQIYMRRHPSRVRTAALFVTLPNDARTPLDFARSAQNALDGVIAECAGDAACRAAFPGLRGEIDRILRQTEREPVRLNVIDPGTGRPFGLRLNRDGLAQTLRYMLYNTDRVAQLPLFVHLAARGDFRPLAETARAWGDYPWSDGYFLAITCAEDVPFIREEEIPAAVAGTFLGDFRIRRQQAACNAWSPARLGPEFLAPTVSDAPTLLLAGERDPVTPPRYTQAVLLHLRNGIQVVIPDGAHSNGGMKGSGDCEWRMMMKLIEAGTTEGFDSSCAARMERPAFALGMAPEVTLAAADLERLAGTYRESKGGFEARLEVFGGNRLRARYSDGTADLFVPTSPTRFRTASDGYNLVFRMEGGRAAALTMEQAGQPVGGEMKRVPATGGKKLALAPCNAEGLPADALCGTHEVFENRASRAGRRIPLRVAVIPANAPNKEPDAITYFAGGPGESAVMDGVWIAEAIRARGPQTRDLLLVDLRGTGGSAPLECPELDGSQSIQGFLDDYMPVEQVRSCRERLSRTADLGQYTSEIAVDDFDEVRAALGYEKLNLVGPSYGSRTAQVYMRRHPSRVRTATLVGTLPNDARIPLDFARSAQNALDGLIAECAGDAACRGVFPRLREEIAEILQRVEKEPVRVELTDPDTGEPLELRLGRNGLAQTLRYMLYNTNRVSQLPLFVHLAARGDFRPLAENARLFGTFLWADGYAFSIACAEDVAFIREDEIPAAVAGTFLGDFRIRRQQAACDAWSAARLGPDLLAPTVSDAPTLLIAGERDPVNPPSYAEQVLRHLRRGLLVVIPDGAHVNGGMKNRECQDDLMARFIEAGSTEKLDTSCVARMERPAFALSLGEPEVALAAADLEPLTGTYRESTGFEARFDRVGGNRLRARYSDGSADILVATSAARFRAANGAYSLAFRMEGGRAAAVTFEQSGQPLGGEMRRVP